MNQLLVEISFSDFLFFININIFRHLKLEIALPIPALNERKHIMNNEDYQKPNPDNYISVLPR